MFSSAAADAHAELVSYPLAPAGRSQKVFRAMHRSHPLREHIRSGLYLQGFAGSQHLFVSALPATLMEHSPSGYARISNVPQLPVVGGPMPSVTHRPLFVVARICHHIAENE